MDEDDKKFWDEVTTKLAIPTDLKMHIERKAAANGEYPWEYILRVLLADEGQ